MKTRHSCEHQIVYPLLGAIPAQPALAVAGDATRVSVERAIRTGEWEEESSIKTQVLSGSGVVTALTSTINADQPPQTRYIDAKRIRVYVTCVTLD